MTVPVNYVVNPDELRNYLTVDALIPIWNKGDTFKLGILFEYDTKKAFEANVEYLDKHFNTLPKTKELMTMAKIEGSRGIAVFEA